MDYTPIPLGIAEFVPDKPTADFIAHARLDVPVLANATMALINLASPYDDEGCWCDMAIGSPMATRHSPACESARQAVRAMVMEATP